MAHARLCGLNDNWYDQLRRIGVAYLTPYEKRSVSDFVQ